jgi:hypothetical protein
MAHHRKAKLNIVHCISFDRQKIKKFPVVSSLKLSSVVAFEMNQRAASREEDRKK